MPCQYAGMRRYIPFIIMGVLTIGAVVGLVVGLAGSHGNVTPSARTLSNPAGSSPSVTPGGSSVASTSTTSTKPAVTTNGDTIMTCALVTSAEAKALLNQIVNNPPVVKAPFCSYEGIVTISPSTRPPVISVTAVTDPKTLLSAENMISNNVTAVCGSTSNSSCVSLLKENNHVTIDGTPAIWRQSVTTTYGDVGAVYAVKDSKLVEVTVSGLPEAEKIALKAMADVIPRL
jgi:hypothetical protein